MKIYRISLNGEAGEAMIGFLAVKEWHNSKKALVLGIKWNSFDTISIFEEFFMHFSTTVILDRQAKSIKWKYFRNPMKISERNLVFAVTSDNEASTGLSVHLLSD